MSENSKIEWTDHTFNPWEGCQKVGPGCDHCYAETRNARYAGGTAVNWGPGAPRRRTSAGNWRKPLAWNAAHAEFFAQHGRRQRVFCASLADVFDNAVDPAWRADLFALIHQTPNLDWLLLTKRIGNVASMLREIRHGADEELSVLDLMPLPNVWLGASIVNQEEADRDIPKLLQVPARVRFLSMEPLLGPVDLKLWRPARDDDRQDLDGYCDTFITATGAGIHWVIVGGESGRGARPMHPAWAGSLRDQCTRAGVPYLFKQWGEWLPAVDGRSITGKVLILEGAAPFTNDPQWHGFEDGQKSARVGKKAAGRLLDGQQHDGFPLLQPLAFVTEAR
ncbi:phage Gp37/Gp68 family protein [Massilia varians]|uniref:phage Gp37/Gp68 family protein n=1 Tax=Massilia varians TaxID=457921 RepID=UPI0025540EC5|nr:phage Gp37/Gp68 family protein [Massilia varians]MDK6077906.1 phage Gp37/Gp68 family protein [Massilia varians]